MAAVLLVCWLAGEAVAQSGEGPVNSPTEGSIGLLLEEDRRPKAGIFAYGPVSLIDQPWQEFNDWLEQSTRFRLGLDNTLVVQQATNGPGDRTGASGELNLFGKGRLIGTSDQDYAGYLGFKARYRYQIGSQTPNDLDSQIGTLWSTTDGFGELPPSLIQLWWEQHLFQNALVVTAGKLDANNLGVWEQPNTKPG